MTDENEPTEYQKAAAGYELFGEPLRKWSQSRKNAADSMGIKFPLRLSEAEIEGIQKNAPYPGIRMDTAIVLWLLSLPDTSDLTLAEVKGGAWTPERAFRQPEKALEAAMEWLGSQEWEPDLQRFTEASVTAMFVASGASLAAFEIETSGQAGEKKVESLSPTDGLV